MDYATKGRMTTMGNNMYNNRKSFSDSGLDTQGGSNLRRLDTQGRILIPVWIRQTLGIGEHSLLEVAQLDETSFVVKKRPSPTADVVLVPLIKSVKDLSVVDLSKLDACELKTAIDELEHTASLLRQERHSRL